jgi:Flp pilus assembly secretin CpaC
LYTAREQQVLNVVVEMNLNQLNEMIHSISPTADVQLRSVNGTIVLRGSVPDSETAQQIAELAAIVQGGEVRNQLWVAGVQQTMLRVVVAEVNREAIKELGVNWATGGSDWSRDFFFANNLGQLNPTVFSSSGVPNLVAGNHQGGQMTYSVAGVGNSATTNVTFGFPRAEFQMFMNALRENDLSRTLAEPNLVAISGQTASFLAGGEVPVPVAQSGMIRIVRMALRSGPPAGWTVRNTTHVKRPDSPRGTRTARASFTSGPAACFASSTACSFRMSPFAGSRRKAISRVTVNGAGGA